MFAGSASGRRRVCVALEKLAFIGVTWWVLGVKGFAPKRWCAIFHTYLQRELS
jgi:hypothetical protein